MTNAAKWTLFLVLGFFAGALSALTDHQEPSIADVFRHGAIGVLPTIGALQTTLKKQLGQE